jgi:hypothetical protein
MRKMLITVFGGVFAAVIAGDVLAQNESMPEVLTFEARLTDAAVGACQELGRRYPNSGTSDAECVDDSQSPPVRRCRGGGSEELAVNCTCVDDWRRVSALRWKHSKVVHGDLEIEQHALPAEGLTKRGALDDREHTGCQPN